MMFERLPAMPNEYIGLTRLVQLQVAKMKLKAKYRASKKRAFAFEKLLLRQKFNVNKFYSDNMA